MDYKYYQINDTSVSFTVKLNPYLPTNWEIKASPGYYELCIKGKGVASQTVTLKDIHYYMYDQKAINKINSVLKEATTKFKAKTIYDFNKKEEELAKLVLED